MVCLPKLNMFNLRLLIMKNNYNVIYTILIFINHFAYGITLNMIGATLVDMRYIYNVSLNDISYMPVAAGTGYLIGSLANYLYTRFNRQLSLAFFTAIISVTIGLLPHYGTLKTALTGLVIMGIGSGAWDSATIIWLVDMWPVGNSPLIQASQFMYGLGSIVSPIILSPFVYGEANVTADNKILTVEDRIEALSYPFIVCAVIQAIVPILFFVFYFIVPYKKNLSAHNPYTLLKTDESKNDDLDNSPNELIIPNRNWKIFICGLCLANYATARIGHFYFSAAMFQYLDIHLSAATSVHLMSLSSFAYTMGRLVTSFISIKVVPDIILFYHYIILFTSLGFLYFGQHELTYITIGTMMIGYGFSAMWPGIFALTERHLRLSDEVCSFFTFLSGGLSLIIPFVLGQSFKTHPMILFNLETIFISISVIMFTTVKIWIWYDANKVRLKSNHIF